MADISFYKYLEAAFRFRLFNPQGQTATSDTPFSYLGYNLTFKRIFYYARRILPKFYASNFPDSEEGNLQMARKVLEKLDKHQDLELERYFGPATAPEENAQIIAEAKTEQAGTEPTASSTKGVPMGGVGLPAPSVPAMPRRIFIAKQTTPTSGMEGGTGVGTAVTNKSGLSFGDKTNRIRNFASSANPFIKTGLNRIGQGLWNMGKIGTGGLYNFGVKAGNGALNAFSRIGRPGGLGGGGGIRNLSKSSNKLAIGLIAGMIFFVLISGVIGGISGTTPTGEAAPLTPTKPVPTNLSSCKFTRTGDSQFIKSSILLNWIINAATTTGIPPQVLASVAMHENKDFVYKEADNNSDAIKTNNYCKEGPPFCEQVGKKLHDDPCTNEELANGARTAKAIGLMQIIDVYNPGKNLCSITESLSIAATKLKADGLTAQPTKDQINQAISAYYNSCNYGSYSYCNEVWDDLGNCKPASGTTPAPPGPIGISLTCPINNFSIICGTATNPVNNCGHGVQPKYETKCDPYYYICDTSSTKYANGWYEKYSPPLYYAIDVEGTNEVKMPYVNGNESVTWTRAEANPVLIGGNAEWGYRINFTAKSSQGKNLYLDFTHLSNEGLNTKNSLNSGETLGKYVTNINHLHIGLSVDSNWVEPAQQARMCVQ